MGNRGKITERRIPGLAVSRGFGIGPVYFVEDETIRPLPVGLPARDVEGEMQRLRAAVEIASSQLKELLPNPDASAPEPVSHILGVQLLIIEGSPFIKRVESIIRQRRVNAEWAVTIVADEYLGQQSLVPDSHIREKRLDIEDIASRLLKALTGTKSAAGSGTLTGSVVVAHELRPSTVTELARQRPAAIVTERGGWTSHSSIIAREFHIPMVSGVRNVESTFFGVDRVMVDGIAGAVILHPDPRTLDHVGSVSILRPACAVSDNHQKVSRTLDGTRIAIRANTDNLDSYAEAERCGAAGIGLFRSESLIRHGRFPNEEEQFAAYTRMADRIGNVGLKIRTFDLSAYDVTGISNERNPALGLRSWRLSLSDPTQFRTQLRAVLRAVTKRNIDIVLPMVSGVSDLARANAIVEQEKDDLKSAGIEIGEPKIGAMIELPSAVLTIDAIAHKVDFLCLGTNDLVQYLLAVDRDNQAVAEWYESLHPAVIRAIADVLAAGSRHGVPVQVCGEMAGSPFYVPLLVGLGARELSMNVTSVRPVRDLLSGINVADCAGLAGRSRELQTADEVEALLRAYYVENWSRLFPPGLLDTKHR